MSNKKVEIRIEISTERLKEIDDMMEQAGFVTRRDLFNNSFSLLQWVIEETKKGNVIASVNEKEELYKPLHMSAIEYIQKGL